METRINDTSVNIINNSNRTQSDQKIHMLIPHIFNELELQSKNIVLIFIFFISFGLFSLISVIFLPEILKLAGTSSGLINFLPKQDMITSLQSIFKNSLILSVVAVFFGMNAYASETDVNKSIYFTLARPISRKVYFSTRFLLKVIGIFFSLFLSTMLLYGYALLYYAPLPIDAVILSAILLSLQVTVTLAFVLVFSAYFSSSVSAGLGLLYLGADSIISFILTSINKDLQWFSPSAVGNLWVNLISTTASQTDINNALLGIVDLLIWIVLLGIIGRIIYLRRDL